MKTYHGYRQIAHGNDGVPITSKCVVRVLVPGYAEYELPPRHDIRNHSPDGFEWGYGGSGPAQLALALVADCRGAEWAVPRIYQRLKLIVAKLPCDGWTLTHEYVSALIDAAANATGFRPGAPDDESLTGSENDAR